MGRVCVCVCPSPKHDKWQWMWQSIALWKCVANSWDSWKYKLNDNDVRLWQHVSCAITFIAYISMNGKTVQRDVNHYFCSLIENYSITWRTQCATHNGSDDDDDNDGIDEWRRRRRKKNRKKKPLGIEVKTLFFSAIFIFFYAKNGHSKLFCFV